MNVTISATELEVAYGTHTALRDIKLRVSGSIFAVIGHNGAGKSTLLKALLGLLPTRSGGITAFAGGSSLTPDCHMAFCPENGAVFADITVEEYIRFWCRVRCGGRNFYKREGKAVIEELAITPLLRRLGRELSKGQRRRVQTAIGFLLNPTLFLFDEPFDGLDVQKTRELADIIAGRSSHMASIVSSHRMDVMERLADAFILLREGQIVAAGGMADLLKAVCPMSYLVRTAQPSAHQSLSEHFRQASVIQRPAEIAVLSSDVSAEDIAQRIPGCEIQPFEPTLTDAMNHHLSRLPGYT